MYHISWVVKNLHYILIGVIVVLVVALAISGTANKKIIRQLQEQKDIERKKSRQIVDSLENIIIFDSITTVRRVDSINSRIETLKQRYEISKKEVEQLQQDISIYLVSSDSLRFAKFKQLITEMD